MLYEGTVAQELKMLVSLVTSQASGCRYRQAHMTNLASVYQASDEKIRAVWSFDDRLRRGEVLRALRSARGILPLPDPLLLRSTVCLNMPSEFENALSSHVFVSSHLFQILEGDEEVVRNLMTSIAADTRHHSVTVFHEAEVEARAFESWRMAYLSPTAEEMRTWVGLPGIATIESLLADVNRDPHRVPRILLKALEALAD